MEVSIQVKDGCLVISVPILKLSGLSKEEVRAFSLEIAEAQNELRGYHLKVISAYLVKIQAGWTPQPAPRQQQRSQYTPPDLSKMSRRERMDYEDSQGGRRR